MMSLFSQPAPRPPMPLDHPLTARVIAKYEREYERAHAASLRLATRRMELPAGASRARITSLNAKWAIAAEHRDRLHERLERARQEFGKTTDLTSLDPR